MKKLFALLLLVCTNVFAFDSSSAFNVVTMSYTANTTIYQRIVLDNTQKLETTLNFTVDVKNGGGRPTQDPYGNPGAYPTQTDSASIYIKLYDSTGAVIATPTSSTYTLHNWGSDPNNHFSTMPGDNLLPWSTASLTYTGSLANVWFIEIYMKGTDGAWWAGNYGPEWRAPTVTVGSDPNNIVYNPEFGLAPNSVKAQGWFNSSNTWAYCGVTSGSAPCVTNVSGVTANMWGGGYDANGGSLAGAVGGYNGTLTTSSADTAATTGTPSSTTTQPAAPTYPSYVTIGSGTPGTMTFGDATAISTAQQSNLNTWATKTIEDGNKIYIEQVNGSLNNVTMDQDGNKNLIRLKLTGTNNTITTRQGVPGIGQNETRLVLEGNNNVINTNQARNTQGNPVGTNGHYLSVELGGWGTNLTVQQSNSGGVGGHYNETTISGNGNSILEKQTDNGNKIMFVKVNGAINTVDVQQKGTGQHRADVTLTGDRNSATVLQEGTTANNATLNLTNAGGQATVNVQQNGGQSVNVTTSCAVTGGCAPILVRQGY